MYKNLKRILLEKNISNKDLAKFLDVAEKTIQNKLSNTSEWTLSEVIKISKYLCPEYSLEWFFKFEETA